MLHEPDYSGDEKAKRRGTELVMLQNLQQNGACSVQYTVGWPVISPTAVGDGRFEPFSFRRGSGSFVRSGP